MLNDYFYKSCNHCIRLKYFNLLRKSSVKYSKFGQNSDVTMTLKKKNY